MADPLETDVRAVFTAHADALPPDAASRLLAADYSIPKRSRWSLVPRVALGAGTAVAAALVLSVATLVATQPQPVFAGWSAEPRTPAAADATAADGTCRSRLASAPGPQLADPSNLSIILTDTRGPFTWVLYSAPTAHVSCLVGPSMLALSVDSTDGRSSAGMVVSGADPANGPVGGPGVPTIRSGEITTSGSASGNGPTTVVGGGGSGSGAGPVIAGSGPTSVSTGGAMVGSTSGSGDSRVRLTQLHLVANGADYTAADGSVASDVAKVGLVLGDGTVVDATVSNGWFAAWWPGSQNATSVRITAADGTVTTDAIDGPPPLQPVPAPSK
jgi:hypothetical protein